MQVHWDHCAMVIAGPMMSVLAGMNNTLFK
jgi:hypothetical protein